MLAIGLVFVVFGIPLMTNLILLLEKKDTKQTNPENSKEYVAAPELNATDDATNRDKITISGIAQKEKQAIYLYLNDERIEEALSKEGGLFSFSDVKLIEGENKIYARTKDDEQTSNNSNTLTISYLKKPPELSIDNPSDGQTISGDNTIYIIGKTGQNVKVTINDFQSIINSDGSFRHRFVLQNGENNIKIVATDQAGNKTEMELKVTFQ